MYGRIVYASHFVHHSEAHPVRPVCCRCEFDGRQLRRKPRCRCAWNSVVHHLSRALNVWARTLSNITRPLPSRKKRNSRRSRALRAHLIFHEFQLGKFHRRRTTKIGAKQPKIYCMAGLREISRFSDWAMSTLSTMAFIRMETTIKRFNWQF